METKQETWPLLALKEQETEINYGQVLGQQPTYQRDGGVWTLDQEQLLIDSVLRYLLPNMRIRPNTIVEVYSGPVSNTEKTIYLGNP